MSHYLTSILSWLPIIGCFFLCVSDRSTVQFDFTVANGQTYQTGEGGPAILLVKRSGYPAQIATVDCVTVAARAQAGDDYVSVRQTLTFPSGVQQRACLIPIINDHQPEATETFHVQLLSSGRAMAAEQPVATVTIVDDDTPALAGQWSAVQPWPAVPIHLHLLPTGQVLFWDRHDHERHWDGRPYLWDPTTATVTPLPLADYDIFCGGHSFTADGRLLIAGGHIDDGVGTAQAVLFDPFTTTWTAVPPMNAGRWYPSNVTLPTGDILVVGGTSTGPERVNPLPQIWEAATNRWRDLVTAPIGDYPEWAGYYPFLYVAPNGKVFDAGPQQLARYLDTAGTGAWSDVAPSRLLYRDYGASVMYDVGKVLIVGGNPQDIDRSWPRYFPSTTAEVIDLNRTNPQWRDTAAMSVGRRHLNTVLLPDGTVLAVGGSALPGKDSATGAIYYAELWDPQQETWQILASHSRYRGYHSTALLLPDGRVLVGGGGHPDPADGSAEPNVEIFSPPYLFHGARPTISSAPLQVHYGESFLLATPDAPNIQQVTWLRLPSVTHAFDQNQRINRLSFTTTANGIIATAPAHANLSPPGHYMLFILNQQGVPSLAHMIQVTTKSS